jgi:hypothetical protein
VLPIYWKQCCQFIGNSVANLLETVLPIYWKQCCQFIGNGFANLLETMLPTSGSHFPRKRFWPETATLKDKYGLQESIFKGTVS